MKSIIIFGDSHTRSFQNKSNVYPFFLGPGKKYNLFDNNIINIEKEIYRFFSIYKYDFSNTLFCLYFGEPNCRYLIKNNWCIHSNVPITEWMNINIINRDAEIQKCIINYSKAIDALKKFTNNITVITPTTAFYPSYNYMTIFNKLLKDTYKELVIDLYSKISIQNIYEQHTYNSIICKQQLLNKDISYDPIHLNNNVCDLFMMILKETHKISFDINTSNNQERFNFKKNKLHSTYLI